MARTLTKKKTHENSIATVPDEWNYESYISRKFGKVSEFDIFQMATDRLRNVLIEGPTGPGKTSAAMAYAAKMRLPFFAIPSNIGIEPSQLFGKYIPAEDGSGSFVWQDGPVTDIVRNGGVLLINEVNFMPERVATVLFGLLDKRREIVLLDHKGEVIHAHMGKDFYCWCGSDDCDDKRVLVLADMNPDYEGTRPLNKAFRNRFAYQLAWGYDPKVERKLVNSDSLVQMAEAIRVQADAGMYETPVATNMLQEFEEVYFDLGLDFAITNFVNHFAADERGSILQVCKTYSKNIEADLSVVVEDEDELDTELEDAPDDRGQDDNMDEAKNWAYEEVNP